MRLTRLLDDILDLSALEGTEAAWTMTPIDPETALRNAIGLCQGLTPPAAVRCSTSGMRRARASWPTPPACARCSST